MNSSEIDKQRRIRTRHLHTTRLMVVHAQLLLMACHMTRYRQCFGKVKERGLTS